MANKSLNDKYEIPFLSEWKNENNERVTALLITHCFKDIKLPVIAYTKLLDEDTRMEYRDKQIVNFYALTVYEFKRIFKKV